MPIKIISYNSIYYNQIINLYIESLNNNFIYSQLSIDNNELKLFVRYIVDNSLLECVILAINQQNELIGFSIVDNWYNYRKRESLTLLKDKNWNIVKDFFDPKKVVYGTYSGVSSKYNGDNLFQKMVAVQIDQLSKLGYIGLIAVGSHPATSLMHLQSYRSKLAQPIHEQFFESYEFNGTTPLANPKTKNIPARVSYWPIDKNPAPILLRSKL